MAVSSFSAVRSASGLRSQMVTSQPSAKSRLAVASPMPMAPPVTIAFFPLRSVMIPLPAPDDLWLNTTWLNQFCLSIFTSLYIDLLNSEMRIFKKAKWFFSNCRLSHQHMVDALRLSTPPDLYPKIERFSRFPYIQGK